VVAQQFAELGARSAQPRADRFGRDLKNDGRIFRAQLFKNTEHEHFAKGLGQALDGPLGPTEVDVCGQGVVLESGSVPADVGLRAFREVSLLAPPRHAVGVAGDGVQSIQQRGVLAQSAGVARGGQPALLEEIFRQGLVLSEANEKSPDPVGVKAVHLVESGGLAGDQAADDVALASHSL
jgi:hypothetical protein